MRRFLILAAVLGLALAGTAPASAQINDDPTIQGTTGLFVIPRANTLEEGSWSLGAALTSVAREEGDSRIRTFTVMGGYGLTDKLEVYFAFEPNVNIDRDFTSEANLFAMNRIVTSTEPTTFFDIPLSGLGINEHPFAIGNEHSGVGDLIAGLKYKFVGEATEYDGMALQTWLKFPTSNDGAGIGTGRLDIGGRLIASLEAWDSVGYNAYVGYLYRDDPDLSDLNAPLTSFILGEEQVILPSPYRFFVSPEFQYGFGFQFPTRATIQFIGEMIGVVTTEDMNQAYTGGDDYVLVQAGARATFDSGWALNIAGNYNTTINVRDPDWQKDADAIDDELRRFGILAGVSYSTSRRMPLSFAGTAPRDLPPVNRAPTLECRAERTTLRQGESVRLFATTSDPDGDPVSVTWSVSAGSLSSTTGSEVTWTTRGVPAGSGPVSARAADGYGGTADCEIRLTVEAPPPPPEDTVVNFACAEFGSGSARIDNRCKAVLDDVALQMRQNPTATAVITGHSDSTGAADRNSEVAQERADNAKTYLMETHGIDASRIETGNEGSMSPMADNGTREGRAQNRRIEIIVTIPGQ